jgi:hypothetical protein
MSGGFLTGIQPPSESRHLTSSTQHWLVVYLPLWKMMEFVSWGYYSQLNGKIRKFNSTHLGKPAQPTQNATTTLDPPIQWEATWAFMVGSQGSPTAMAYIPWGLRQSLQCLCWAPAFVRKPRDFAFLSDLGRITTHLSTAATCYKFLWWFTRNLPDQCIDTYYNHYKLRNYHVCSYP